MSEGDEQPVAEPARCPRCGADLAPEQEWCLSCGTAARTAIASTPPWRLPVAAIALVVALCGIAVAWALVELTDNDAEVQAIIVRPEPVTTPTVPTTAATTATAPATTPPAATTPPDATTAPPPVEPPAETAPPAVEAPPAEDLGGGAAAP